MNKLQIGLIISLFILFCLEGAFRVSVQEDLRNEINKNREYIMKLKEENNNNLIILTNSIMPSAFKGSK